MNTKKVFPDSDQPQDEFERAIAWHIKNLDAGIVDGETPYMSGQRSGFAYAVAIYRDCRQRSVI